MQDYIPTTLNYEVWSMIEGDIDDKPVSISDDIVYVWTVMIKMLNASVGYSAVLGS